MLVGIWLVLVGMLVYSYVSGLIFLVKEVSVYEMMLLINCEDVVVLDICLVNDYKVGYVIGVCQIKFEELCECNFSKFEKYKDIFIIVVCVMGNSVCSVVVVMIKVGFVKVNVLCGGMNVWIQVGLFVVK